MLREESLKLLDGHSEKDYRLSLESPDTELSLCDDMLRLLDADIDEDDTSWFDAQLFPDEEQLALLHSDPGEFESLDARLSREDEFAASAALELDATSDFSEVEDSLDSVDTKSPLRLRLNVLA